MSILSIFNLFGGLAFFLYGMHVMSSGLEKMAGGKLEQLLKKMTSNPFKSIILGCGITIAIQSSSAMTVMLVGLVNSGIMQLQQTIGVIMGSNIGTTLTAWILSLAGIESDNIFVNLLKPESFSPIIALIGIGLIMLSKKNKNKDIGEIMVGFSVLMYGMELMSGAVSPLADMPEFSNILTAFSNPFLGVVVGAVFTGIIQSSAASVGILQALSMTGGITYGMAIPIIMGQNIGTCVTSMISSIGVNKNAKRVAVVHVLFNLIGTSICLIGFYGINTLIELKFLSDTINPVGVAIAHSAFNIFTTVILLPFSKQLEKLARLLVHDKKEKVQETSQTFLDERLLRSPSFAIAECRNMTVKMSDIARDTILSAIDLIDNYDESTAQTIIENEDLVDNYEDKLGTYLVKLSSKELSDSDSNEISRLLHSIGDFERISDHAVNILNTAKEIHSKGIMFSDSAKKELKVLVDAIKEIVCTTIVSFEKNDSELAMQIEPLEQVIDNIAAEMKTRHIKRLQNGQCTIEMGFILSDLLNNYKRISDHCSNIAVCIIQTKNSVFDTHIYLNDIKNSGNPAFEAAFDLYSEKYQLA